MTPVLAALMLWASQLSGLPIPEHYVEPQIVFDTMKDYRIPGMKNERPDGLTFMENGGPILLNSKTWPKHTAIEQSCIEVHELVHYLQYLNGLGNMKHPEPPAYKAMAKCFEHYGDKQSAQWAYNMAITEPY